VEPLNRREGNVRRIACYYDHCSLAHSGGRRRQDEEQQSSYEKSERNLLARATRGVTDGVGWNDRLDFRNNVPLADKLLSDLGLGDVDIDADRTFDRVPYAVTLATDDGRLDFAYVMVHVTYGSRVGPRIAEVRALGGYYNDVFPHEADVLLMGDFNRKAGNPKSLGWLFDNFGLVDTTETGMPTVISGANTYDHILFHPVHTSEYAGTHGVVLFDETKFADDDDAVRRAISDHRPVLGGTGRAGE